MIGDGHYVLLFMSYVFVVRITIVAMLNRFFDIVSGN